MGEEERARASSSAPVSPSFLHFPITDLTAPSLPYLETIVDAVRDRIERGDVVYIHCWGGRGRSGTVGPHSCGYIVRTRQPQPRFCRAFRRPSTRVASQGPRRKQRTSDFSF